MSGMDIVKKGIVPGSTPCREGSMMAGTRNKGMTPAEALKHFRWLLTPFERLEIFHFQQVWYLGRDFKEKVHGSFHLSNSFGFDDEFGNYMFEYGDHLAYRYEIIEELGSGSFGIVLKCKDHKCKNIVAVKIDHTTNSEKGIKEVETLTYLRENDVDNTGNVVHMLNNFMFRNHLCIVFELEGQDLADVLHNRDYRGISMVDTRHYAISLLKCLLFLKKIGIVHGDIKPDNIVISREDPFTVKLIDFGGSGLEPQRIVAHTISYTSPEGLLGDYFTTAHDMWSLGCTLVKLVTGECVFFENRSTGLMGEMVELLGKPPSDVFNAAPEWSNYFGSNSSSGSSSSSSGSSGADSKSTNPISGSSGSAETSGRSESSNNSGSSESSGSFSSAGSFSRSRESLSGSYYSDQSIGSFIWGFEGDANNGMSLERRKSVLDNLMKSCNSEFADFIARCLEYNPAKRLTPQEAMEHPWIEQHKLYPPRIAPSHITHIPITSIQRPTSGDSSSGPFRLGDGPRSVGSMFSGFIGGGHVSSLEASLKLAEAFASGLGGPQVQDNDRKPLAPVGSQDPLDPRPVYGEWFQQVHGA